MILAGDRGEARPLRGAGVVGERGKKRWAARGFSWAGLVWGLGWVEFG